MVLIIGFFFSVFLCGFVGYRYFKGKGEYFWKFIFMLEFKIVLIDYKDLYKNNVEI